MSTSKTVKFGQHRRRITGSPDDPYFQQAGVFAAESAALATFVKTQVPPGLILDIGANIGLTALAMHVADPQRRILAFEPSPTNCAFFRLNTADIDQIELRAIGLADVPGTLDFVSPLAGANAHIATPDYQYAQHPDFHPLRVPVETLDRLMPEIDQPVALIKIDVEGFEPNVLSGARELIAQQRPLIWLEFNSVALNIAHGYSPTAFARVLFQCFEVSRPDACGQLQVIAGPDSLVHGNITLHGGVEDIVLRPLPDQRIPSLEAMTLPQSVCRELAHLRQAH